MRNEECRHVVSKNLVWLGPARARATATAALAGEQIAIREGADFAAATVLRALAGGLSLDDARVVAETGVPPAVWRALIERMKPAHYGVLLRGHQPDAPAERRLHEALSALVRELNDFTRFVSLTLPAAGNDVGAENVLAWRTGYATAVDFSRGFPRSNPAEFAAEKLLAEHEVDAVLAICDDPISQLGAAARRRFESIPSIALDWRDTPTTAAAAVVIPLATIGVESGGTIFRLDGVPLALRPVVATAQPADHEALSALRALLADGRQRRAVQPTGKPAA